MTAKRLLFLLLRSLASCWWGAGRYPLRPYPAEATALAALKEGVLA